MTSERRKWRCPSCSKLFSIPAHNADPMVCPACADAENDRTNEITDFDPPSTDDAPERQKTRPLVIIGGVVGVLFAGCYVLPMMISLFSGEPMMNSLFSGDRGRREIAEQTVATPAEGDVIADPPQTFQPPPRREQVQKKSWVRVGKWSGSGAKTTERFESHAGEMRINYMAVSDGYFGFTVHGSGPSNLHLGANEVVNSKTTDTTHIHSSRGNYYLEVNAANVKWAIIVEDWR